MRLTQLCESMIKLPPRMPSDFMEFIYAYIIDFMEVTTDDRNKGFTLLDHLGVKPSKPDLHKKIKFNHPEKIISKTKVRLNAYNFPYQIDDADKFLIIRLVDMGSGFHGGYDDDKNLLTINVHSLKMLLATSPVNEKFVAYIVKEIENTIEHELMHYVQHKSFGKVDPKQLNKYDSKNGSHEEYIKYATSPVEFLPTLKSEYKSFEAKVHFLQKDIHINNNDKMQLLRYYIGDESARVGRLHEFLDDFKSPILWGLREQNPSLWKKAVKVMVEQFNHDPENHQ